MGAQEIAGMLGRLNRAFDDLGIKSEYYWLYNYKANYAYEDSNNKPKGFQRYLKHTKKIRATQNKFLRFWWTFLQMWDTLYIFFHAIRTYNDFLYIFGHGMFYFNRYLRPIQELEFFLLKVFKKRVIMWLCGSDSRAPYCDVDIYKGDPKRLKSVTKKKKQNIRMLEKYATLIDYPASSHFHTKPYIQYGAIGVPVDENELAKGVSSKNEKIVILHAPSNKECKGSGIIQQIIEEIKSEGYNIEYVEVSGMPHSVVINKMASADIVIDQLYSDTPLAGFAAEACFNGVPVVVAGYYAEYYQEEWIKPIPPTIFCLPEEVKEKIIYLIENEDERQRIGQEEQDFVKQFNLSTEVAKKFCAIFDNAIPDEWWFHPNRNKYIWGCGLPKEKVVKNIVTLIDAYGMKALNISPENELYKHYQKIYFESKNIK